jgi:hypothetical protein
MQTSLNSVRARDQIEHGTGPRFVGEELHRLNRQCPSRQANAAHVGDIQKRIAKFADVRRLQPRNIPAGHDDILDLRMQTDVVERGRPVLCARHMFLLNDRRIDAHGITSRAVLAVDGADRRDQKEHLVGIAMNQTRHRRVFGFFKRVDDQTG